MRLLQETGVVTLWILWGALVLGTLAWTGVLDTEPSQPESGLHIDFPAVVEVWRQGKAIFVDARPEHAYAMAHIPGALNLPVGKARELLALLPQDHSVLLITYCGSPECPNAWQLMNLLLEQGYENVQLFHRGLRGWQSLGLPIAEGRESI